MRLGEVIEKLTPEFAQIRELSDGGTLLEAFDLPEGKGEGAAGELVLIQLHGNTPGEHAALLESISDSACTVLFVIREEWIQKANFIAECLRISKKVFREIVLLTDGLAALVAEPEAVLIPADAPHGHLLARLVNEGRLAEMQVQDLERQLAAALKREKGGHDKEKADAEQIEQLQEQLAGTHAELTERAESSSQLESERLALQASLDESVADNIALKSTVRNLERELHAASTLVGVAEKKVEDTDGRQDRAQHEVARLKNDIAAIKGSRSFRLITLLSQTRKSPRDIPRLPSRLWKLLRDRPTGPARAVTSPGTQRAPLPGLELSGYLTRKSDMLAAAQPWIGVVSSVGLAEQLAQFGNSVALTPNNWRSLFEQHQPDKVLVDASDSLRGGPWETSLEGSAYGQPFHLLALLKEARQAGVPTTLWMNVPGAVAQTHTAMARLFDEVVITDSSFFDATDSIVGFDRLRRRNMRAVLSLPAPVYGAPYVAGSSTLQAWRSEFACDLPDEVRIEEAGTGAWREAGPPAAGVLLIPSFGRHAYIPAEVLSAAGRGILPVCYGAPRGEIQGAFANLFAAIETPDDLSRLHASFVEDPDLFQRWVFACAVESCIRHDLMYRLQDLVGDVDYFESDAGRVRHAVLADVRSYRDANRLQAILDTAGGAVAAVCFVVDSTELAEKLRGVIELLPHKIIVTGQDGDPRLEGLAWCLEQDAEDVSWLGSLEEIDDRVILRLQNLRRGTGVDVSGYAGSSGGEARDGILPENIQHGYQSGIRLSRDALVLSRAFCERSMSLPDFDQLLSAACDEPRSFAGPVMQNPGPTASGGSLG